MKRAPMLLAVLVTLLTAPASWAVRPRAIGPLDRSTTANKAFISAIAPAAATAGTPGVSLTVTGANFRSNSRVYWGSTALATSYRSNNKLVAAVPSSLLAAPGTAKIYVATSNAVTFTILTPTLVVTSTALPGATVAKSYETQLTAGGGATPYSWKLASGGLPAGMTLSSSGALSGTPTLAGTYSFTAQVSDSGAVVQTASAAVALKVSSALTTLAVVTTSIPNGTSGQSYSASLSASGGTLPYSWQLYSGSLPTGVTLNSSGALSGVPTQSGSFNFSARVADTSSPQQAAVKAFSFSIATAPTSTPVPSPLAIATSSLPGGTVGQAYSASLAATGGSLPYTWSISAGTMPAGISLSSSGVLSGSPTAASNSSVTFAVKDATAQTSTRTLTIAIASAPTTTPPPSSPGSTPLPFTNLKTNDWNVYPFHNSSIFGVWQDTGVTYTDPTFMTKMKRIAVDKALAAAAPNSTSVMPFYAKEQAWSNDMAYMVAWANNGWVELYDGGNGMLGHTPYQLIRVFNPSKYSGFNSCSTDNEVRWSMDPATPHKFFHVCFAKFYIYDADTDTDTLLVDWNARFPGKSYSFVTEQSEGNPSSIKDPASGMYNRYWVFNAYNGGSTNDVIVYDRHTDTTAATAQCTSNAACGVLAVTPMSSLNVCPGGSSGLDWPSMSPTGQYVLLMFGQTSIFQYPHAGCGLGVYTISNGTLVWQRQLVPTDWHGDVGFDAQGNEVFVGLWEPTTTYTSTSQIAEFSSVRISDGMRTRMQMWGNDSNGVLRSMFGGVGLGFHVSMRGTVDPNKGIPGYALISWYNGSAGPSLAQYDATLFGSGEQDVLYLPGDGSTGQAKVYRINQTGSYRVAYGDEPHCVASPDWTKTLCGTNWRNTSTEQPIYPLVTELP